MNKELELEAEKYAEIQLKGLSDKSSKFECINDFIEGATSKYVEKQKLEFAIEQLKRFREATFGKGVDVIKELEQKLQEL